MRAEAPAGGLARIVLALLVLASAEACKKKAAPGAPDAGPIGSIKDEDLGFELALVQGWSRGKASTESTIVEAYRSAPPGKTFLVAPRLAVTSEKTGARDTDALVRATTDDLKSLDKNPGVRIKRTAISARMIGTAKVGDIELSYEVRPAGGDTKREVVHRSLVTRRERKDGSAAALTLTATYLADDAELIGPEIQRMFATLVFVEGAKRP